jgi:5'-nucleotidase (lipoprotein e(P4) family)
MKTAIMCFAGVLIVASAGCRTASAPRSTPAPTSPAPAVAPRQTHENLNAVVWMQTASEYRAAARQAYRLARIQLDAALADPSWTAATEQTAPSSSLPPAVVLDLDETVLDNSAFQARQVADSTPYVAVPYSEEAWNKWCEERKAGAVAGAIDFVKYATGRGVTPVYITNRDHAVETATRDVLASLGIPVDTSRDTVLTRHENGWDSSDKSARRQFVAASFRILLLVGDNFEDFVSGTRASLADRITLEQKYDSYWGTKWIVLPNATYGSWEQAIAFGQGQLTDAQMLAAKRAALMLKR